MVRSLLAAMMALGFTISAQASTLIVTCGNNAYESLDEKNLNKAEFVLKLKMKGPNNPAEIQIARDVSADLSSDIADLKRTESSVTLTMKNYDKYEITGLKDCESIETGTADIAWSKYVGGFAGYSMPVKAKCSCLNKEL